MTRPPSSLATMHDVALLDLDGVVYIGEHAVPGARAALTRARDAGMRLAFVTNNAGRPPEEVAEHLSILGIAATAPSDSHGPTHRTFSRFGAYDTFGLGEPEVPARPAG